MSGGRFRRTHRTTTGFFRRQDARKNPNVCWHLRDRLFAPGCTEDRHCDPGRPAVRFPVVQEQLSDVEVSVAKTDLKTAQGSLRHANPQVLLDRYARSVTNEMVAARGRFLEECGGRETEGSAPVCN